MNTKKLGLPSVIATGVGLIVATSCLMSLGQGAGAVGISFIIAMLLACAINIITALSLAELNALMPDLTGGLAQYTLASLGPFVTIITMVSGYLVCNTIAGSVECAMFGNTMVTVFGGKIPSSVYCVVLLLLLIAANLNGIDMFAKIQDVVAYGLIGSVVLMGLIGALRLGTGRIVRQPLVLSSDPKAVFSMVGLAFFLFLGCEFVIPISKNVRNAKKTIPLGMILSLLIVCGMEILVVLGMHNYTDWSKLASSASPHIYYGVHLLGNAGRIWMALVSVFAVISTVNSVISSLAYICAGMAKIGSSAGDLHAQESEGRALLRHSSHRRHDGPHQCDGSFEYIPALEPHSDRVLLLDGGLRDLEPECAHFPGKTAESTADLPRATRPDPSARRHRRKCLHDVQYFFRSVRAGDDLPRRSADIYLSGSLCRDLDEARYAFAAL